MYGDTLLRSQFGKPSGLFGALFMGPILNLSNTRLVNAAVDLLDPRTNDTVLDIGFGGGLSLVTLAAKAPRAKIVGVDYSREMVETAARLVRGKKLDARVSVKWGDVAKLPFRAGTFHKVLTVNSLYYWPDLVASLREVARVMKRGGRLAAGFRSAHSHRIAASKAPDRMAWMPRMVPLAIGLQTCGRQPDSLQSWPGRGRVACRRVAGSSASGSPAIVVVRP